MTEPRTLRCSTCKETKPETDFGIRKGRPRGRHWQCRLCKAAWNRGYRKRHPDRVRKTNQHSKLRIYGVSPEQYAEAAKSGCQICGSKTELHIDHDHATGRFRGILCRPHNLGIGFFRDDPELLAKAIMYLQGGDL